MSLDKLRQELNQIDDEMMKLFVKRMTISKAIGAIKKSQGLPVFDALREQEVLIRCQKKLNNESLWPAYKRFMEMMMNLSKDVQNES